MTIRKDATWTPPESTFHAENIPRCLRALDRWVCWRWEPQDDPAKKHKKRPQTPNHQPASTTNPATWSSFADVEAAYLADDWTGVGLVLPSGLVGVDLDDCLTDGKLSAAAALIVSRLDTYCEISPSGTGVKLIGSGQLAPDLAKTCHKRGVELYDEHSARYFTLTGRRIGDADDVNGISTGAHFLQSLIATPPRRTPQTDGAKSDHRREALRYLSALHTDRVSAYDDWLRVGMALKTTDDDLLAEWDAWSQRSDKYAGTADTRRRWESFTRTDGRLVDIEWLRSLAIEDGFNPAQLDLKIVSAAELCRTEIHREYYVEDFLVKGEPMLLGGAAKSLKTSIALDLAVSLATATPFLDFFEVRAPRRVLFLSGESADSTLQALLRDIAAHKDLDPDQFERLYMSFVLPKLTNSGHVRGLIADIEKRRVDVVVVDPLYRSLEVGADASNLYAMGGALNEMGGAIHESGVTPVLLHHFRKQGATFDTAPELEDFSQSGTAEFARQFALLKRRERYTLDGNHALWFSWGGSAGHQGAAVLQIATGTRATGLTWSPRLTPQAEWLQQQEQERSDKKRQATEQRDAEREAARETDAAAVLQLVISQPDMSAAELRSASALSSAAFGNARRLLIDTGQLVQIDAAGGRKLHRAAK